MKCKKCCKEYSDSVVRIHEQRCNNKKEDIIIEDIIEDSSNDLTKSMVMAELNRKDIDFNPRDKKEVLLDLLNEAE